MSVDGRIAVCPGSYDPVTNGHVDIITRTSRVFERVVVGVVNQPVRKQQTLFTAEERKAFIDDAIADLDNVEVKVMSNLLVEFARENGASAIIKGLRAISDFEYEFEMNQLNRKLAADIESMYISSSPPPSFFRLRELQLSLLHGCQGDRDLRGRCRRSGARSGCKGACGTTSSLIRRAWGVGRSLQSGPERQPGTGRMVRCVSFSDCKWTF